jgi:hypothetical protein
MTGNVILFIAVAESGRYDEILVLCKVCASYTQGVIGEVMTENMMQYVPLEAWGPHQ